MEKLQLTSKHDDLNIHVVVNQPKEPPLAVVQLVHGMCGCKERFFPIMKFLSDNGIACISSDLRGHGQSIKNKQDLGYFYSGGYKALVEDLRIVSDWGLQRFQNIPFFLLGHSMGSLAVRIYAKYDDSALSGLIICGSPSQTPFSNIGRFLTDIACASGFDKKRSKILQFVTDSIYNINFASEGPKAWTCSNPESRKQFKETPECNFYFTINGANNLMKMMKETYNLENWKVSNPTMPILFISGSEDPVMGSPKNLYTAATYMNKVGYQTVSCMICPKMRHEVLNEINKDYVYKEILDFVKTR